MTRKLVRVTRKEGGHANQPYFSIGSIFQQYHDFWHHVTAGTIVIEKVATQENLKDVFTKPLPLVTFQYLRRKVVRLVGLCEGVLEYASNAEAWLACTPTLSMCHTHQLMRHCFSTDIIFPFLDLTIDPAL